MKTVKCSRCKVDSPLHPLNYAWPIEWHHFDWQPLCPHCFEALKAVFERWRNG